MLNKLSLISVVMATYNGKQYLAQQLDSLLQQTYANLEIIIVDDASTDSSVEIIKTYQTQYPQIKLYQNAQNLGLVKTFERAIELSSGDYIALCDQDDVWLPNKLEVLVNNIGDNLLIHSDAKLIDADGNIISQSHFNLAKKRNKVTFVDYLISNNVTGCTCMFSRKLKELALPFPEYFYSHDHYLALVASFYGKIKLVDEALILYRQHGNNLIGAKRPQFEQFFLECKKKADSYDSMLKLPQFKNNKDIELFRDYRYAIYARKYLGAHNIARLIKQKSGIKLLGYYFVLTFIPRKLGRGLYNFYTKLKYS